MKTNQIIVITVVAVIVIAGAGLFLRSNNGSNNKDIEEPPDSDYYPVTVNALIGGVKHAQTFNKSPERVVTTWNANVELMCYFGLENRIVGAYANENYEAIFSEFQSKYNAVEKMPTNTMSIEKVRSLNPDLILGWSSTFTDSYLGSLTTWNGYGTNGYVTNRPSDSVNDYITLLENIGTIFNKQNAAAQKIAEFTSAYEDVKKKTSSLSNNEKVKALLIEPGYEGGCFVYGSKFLSGDLITQAGGYNMFDGAMERLTFERIASFNPDIIFIMSGSGSNPLALKEAIDKFQAIPGFASMTDNVVAFGFYEVYMGGILPDNIINRMFEAMYPA